MGGRQLDRVKSMHYEMFKHTGELPIVGVNTFRNPHGDQVQDKLELARSTDEEKQSQPKRLQDFHVRKANKSPPMLKRPQQAVIDNAKRVRGAHGRGARVLAGADHACAVRGERAVPAQHVRRCWCHDSSPRA